MIKYIKILKTSNFTVVKHAGESGKKLKIFLPAECMNVQYSSVGFQQNPKSTTHSTRFQPMLLKVGP
jgi:hypothetical protein